MNDEMVLKWHYYANEKPLCIDAKNRYVVMGKYQGILQYQWNVVWSYTNQIEHEGDLFCIYRKIFLFNTWLPIDVIKWALLPDTNESNEVEIPYEDE